MQRKHLKKITYRDENFFIRNKVNRLINEAMRSFYRRRIYQNQRETKHLWSILREITKVRPKSESIKEISVKILMIQDSFEILNVMNEYFLTVGDRLANNLYDDSDSTNLLQYLGYSSHQFSFSEVYAENVRKIVAELNNSRSSTLFNFLFLKKTG